MFRLSICFIAVSCIIPITAFTQIGSQPVSYNIIIPNIEKSVSSPLSHQEQFIAVDSYAKSAPEFDGNLSRLVDYLIQPYKNNEVLKVRAIFAWMVYHLNYDQFKADNLKGKTRDGKPRILNSGDTFKTRIGICGDFADLFVKMAGKANLKAVRIDGVAGEKLTRQTAVEAKHAWNAVRIDKKWYLLDVTWAMAGDYTVFADLTQINEYKKIVRERRQHTSKLPIPENRQINNKWFLTDPHTMIETHFPNNVKWQLLEKPIHSRKVFEQNETFIESTSKFNTQPIKMIMPK